MTTEKKYSEEDMIAFASAMKTYILVSMGTDEITVDQLREWEEKRLVRNSNPWSPQ